MKKLTTGKIWQFAVGQFGWSMLSGLISNWLVYFYQPDDVAVSQGQTLFIPQGLVVLGLFTVIGAITAFGRIFDAFTDPMIASLSDRCRSKNGRRIPFMKWASLPLALSTVLVFWSPVHGSSPVNVVFLFLMVMAYYLSMTAYCTPY
ncbi:MAG: MFS transporter, partial [Lachnospiraceae bacterium]|nr:MFS transporter [Lachnospiraceae bacterium]